MDDLARPADDRPDETPATPRKRRYVSPELVEYGSIGKLTRGGSGTVGEGVGGMSMPMCL